MKKKIAFFMTIVFGLFWFMSCSALAQKISSKAEEEVAIGRKVKCLRTIYEDGVKRDTAIPKGLAVDKDGKLFVIFLDRSEVQVFGPRGNFLYRFGKKGTETGDFLMPLSIEVAGNGTVFVLDSRRKKVLAFSNKGQFQYEFDFTKKIGDEKPVRCTKMGLDRPNRVLYLADGANANLRLFNLKGDFLGLFPLDTKKAKPMAVPGKTSFDSKGRIYIIDSINGVVQVYSAKKKFLFSFGELGVRLGNFARPIAVSVNRQGNIYVLDRLLSVIQVFDAKGKVLGVIKDTEVPDGLHSTEPFDMAMDDQGLIYVVLQGLHCVKVLRD